MKILSIACQFPISTCGSRIVDAEVAECSNFSDSQACELPASWISLNNNQSTTARVFERALEHKNRHIDELDVQAMSGAEAHNRRSLNSSLCAQIPVCKGGYPPFTDF